MQPRIPLIGIYPCENTCTQKTYLVILTAALFIKPKKKKKINSNVHEPVEGHTKWRISI